MNNIYSYMQISCISFLFLFILSMSFLETANGVIYPAARKRSPGSGPGNPGRTGRRNPPPRNEP